MAEPRGKARKGTAVNPRTDPVVITTQGLVRGLRQGGIATFLNGGAT